MDMAIEANLKKKELLVKEMVPPEYHEFLVVFDEQKVNQFLESKEWDHKINMKEGFEPKSFKNDNLTPEEQIELDMFLKENLEIYSTITISYGFCIFLCQKERWENFNLAKIINFPNFMDELKGAKYFSKMDFNGDITIFKSKKAMNGKQLSKQIKDYSNQWSCSLECAIHLPHFNL